MLRPWPTEMDFGNDVGGGLVRGMDHLGPGVLVLAVVGQGDGNDLAAGLAALQHDPGILHGQAAADVAVDPLDLGLLVGEAALGDEIEDIGAQFWTVMYWILAPFIATSSTTALCRVEVENFGAVQPSM